MLHVWYMKKRGDWDMLHEDNDVIETEEGLTKAKKRLRHAKHTCLVMRAEYPRAYKIH